MTYYCAKLLICDSKQGVADGKYHKEQKSYLPHYSPATSWGKSCNGYPINLEAEDRNWAREQVFLCPSEEAQLKTVCLDSTQQVFWKIQSHETRTNQEHQVEEIPRNNLPGNIPNKASVLSFSSHLPKSCIKQNWGDLPYFCVIFFPFSQLSSILFFCLHWVLTEVLSLA